MKTELAVIRRREREASIVSIGISIRKRFTFDAIGDEWVRLGLGKKPERLEIHAALRRSNAFLVDRSGKDLDRVNLYLAKVNAHLLGLEDD